MRRYLLIFTMILLGSSVSAQYVDNALLFSQQNYGSTARLKAMGNAFGALGGDFGALSINPAGVAIYQRTELSTTMGLLNLNSTESTYQGNSFKEENNNFNFKNFGYVSAIPASGKSSGLVSLNFGLGYNRLANFNQNTAVGSNSSPYSRMDAFAQNTNGINFNNLVTTDGYDPYNSVPWESKLAWETYLIDVSNPTGTGNQYTTFLLENETVQQLQTTSQEGFINEYVATFGANFNHRLYLGMTLGMQDLFFDEAKLYSENGDNRLGSNAGSYNFKFGAIFRPVPVLRLGVAIHTPTYFKFNESYSSSMSSDLSGISDDADGKHSESSPVGTYKYDFHTPMHVIGSLAYQVAKKALISVDYEFVDYGAMKYSNGLGGGTFQTENGEIETIYKATHTLRVGAEYKPVSAVSLRGGVEFIGNPYQASAYGLSQPNADYKYRTYNGGIGYRHGNFSLDVTYSLGDRTNYLYMYQVEGVNVDPVKYQTLNHELLLTLAIRM
jgi:long-subunit fatty acid transport protein